MTTKNKTKTVNISDELELAISKYQTSVLEKTGKKPTVKEIVENALRGFLNEK